MNSDFRSSPILFLSWNPPWPAFSGADIRTSGLLREVSKGYSVELVTLSSADLSIEQRNVLQDYAQRITVVRRRDSSLRDNLIALALMLWKRLPYHTAVLQHSLRQHPDIKKRLRANSSLIYANLSHWGTLISDKRADNWILDQQNADVDFWRIYSEQDSRPLFRTIARMNYYLARSHFPTVYNNVGCVISVCARDRELTLALAPHSKVEVIENGVDCSHLTPERSTRAGPPRLLFTGTSAKRNLVALHRFARGVLPLVAAEIPDVELLVAGNFVAEAQAEFSSYPQSIRFTGRVPDIRPFFNKSDVYISPFTESYGSKLKIAEAMAMAMPIVSTPQGIRGFSLVHDESVLIAQDEQEFARHTIQLLKNPQLRRHLGTSARSVALATIDWKVLGTRLRRVIRAVGAGLPRKEQKDYC